MRRMFINIFQATQIDIGEKGHHILFHHDIFNLRGSLNLLLHLYGFKTLVNLAQTYQPISCKM